MVSVWHFEQTKRTAVPICQQIGNSILRFNKTIQPGIEFKFKIMRHLGVGINFENF
jgi:hypothetical protein